MKRNKLTALSIYLSNKIVIINIFALKENVSITFFMGIERVNEEGAGMNF